MELCGTLSLVFTYFYAITVCAYPGVDFLKVLSNTFSLA